MNFHTFYDILKIGTNFTQPPPSILAIGVGVTLFYNAVIDYYYDEDWYGYTLLYLENLLEFNKSTYYNFEIKTNQDLAWQMYVLEDIIPSIENILIHMRNHFKDLGLLSIIEEINRPYFS